MSTLLSLQEQTATNEFDRVYPLDGSTSISLYKKGIFYGLLRDGEAITEPIYTPDVRIISDRYAVVRLFKPVSYHNNGAIIDLHTGKEVFNGFNAYFIRPNACIAFRVDGPNDSMRWGIFSIIEDKLISDPVISLTYLHQYVEAYLSKFTYE